MTTINWAVVAEQFGVAVGQLAVVYAPALTRMTSVEYAAVMALLQEKNTDAAKAATRAAMTEQELANETAVLASEAVAMATNNLANWNTAESFWLAVLNAAVQIATSAIIGAI